MITYFKSRQESNPVVYIEDDEGWKSYNPGGAIQKNLGPLPNYIRQYADEVPLADVIDLIRSCEAEANLKARAQALEPSPPMGIGGWLILPIIGLCAVALLSLVDILRYLPALFRAWDVLTTQGTEAYHPLWGPYIVFATFVQSFLLVAPLALLWLIAKKKRVLPLVIICFYAAALFFTVVVFAAVVAFLSQWAAERGVVTSDMVLSATRAVWQTIVSCGIWIPYFMLSKRVRATFTEPFSGRTRTEEAEARRSIVAAMASESRAREEQPAATAPQEAVPAGSQPIMPYIPQQPRVDPILEQRLQASARAAKTRRFLLIPVIFILAVVALSVTGLAVWREADTAQASHASVSTDSAGNDTKHYSNKDFSYSFDYPAGWTLSDSPDAAGGKNATSVYDPFGEAVGGQGADSAIVGAVKLASLAPTLEQLKANIKARLKDDLAADGLVIVEDYKDTTVGGLPAIVALASTNGADGDDVIVPFYYIFGKGHLYYILFNYTNRATDHDKPKLDAMLGSFRPTP